MPQVTLNIGDKTYRMACAEGEEPRLQALAAHFGARVDRLAESFPRMPPDHLFLMAALLVTDELFDAREDLHNTLKQIARLGNALNANDNAKAPTGSEMAEIVRDASARLDKMGDPKPVDHGNQPSTPLTDAKPAADIGEDNSGNLAKGSG